MKAGMVDWPHSKPATGKMHHKEKIAPLRTVTLVHRPGSIQLGATIRPKPHGPRSIQPKIFRWR